MNDRMFELCKKVIANEGIIDYNGNICSDIDDCYEYDCIFGNVYPSCHKNSKRCLEIAKKYIDDIDFVKEVVEECMSIKEEVKMEKTLLDIIEDNKNGVWENDDRIITMEDGVLAVTLTKRDACKTFVLGLDEVYTLQRKEYSYEEAFKAYEYGEEIEGKYSHNRYKKDPNMNMYKNDIYCESAKPQISFNEIFEPWYINN